YWLTGGFFDKNLLIVGFITPAIDGFIVFYISAFIIKYSTSLEKDFNKAQAMAQIGNWRFNIAENKLTWSNEVYRIFEVEFNKEMTFELFNDRIHPDDQQKVIDVYNNSIENKIPYTVIHRIIANDGHIKYIEEKGESKFDSDGNASLSFGTAQDVTENFELKMKLEKLALHDALTGLYNRGNFDERLQDEMNRTLRYGTHVSLLILDIDFFKKVNDTYGHQAGDAVLKSIADTISNSIRKSDYAARYGGEEFSVILPETDQAKAIELAERIRLAIEQKEFRVSESDTIHLTISIGVGSSSERITSPELLIQVADGPLYNAKENGRNQVRYI
ncbi:MAG: sensor domain-containing diguanylate cyclase, partial [Helicobacteraceae bacterium]|nr:sensor domain-containing diguanylate cyclase [Helicobacteraceae bacterium]